MCAERKLAQVHMSKRSIILRQMSVVGYYIENNVSQIIVIKGD